MNFRSLISMPLGSLVPGGASATRSPTRILGAPETTWARSAPTSSCATWRWSDPGTRLASTILATTTPSQPMPWSMIRSTSVPERVNASASCSAGSGSSMYCCSQSREIRMGTF